MDVLYYTITLKGVVMNGTVEKQKKYQTKDVEQINAFSMV